MLLIVGYASLLDYFVSVTPLLPLAHSFTADAIIAVAWV